MPDQRAPRPTLLAQIAGKRVILYGAGKIGQRIHSALNWFGQPVDAFWDMRPEQVDWKGDTPVVEPDFSPADRTTAENMAFVVTIFAENIRDQIRDRLHAAGYQQVFFAREDITELLHAECASRKAAGQFEFDLPTCHSCPVVSDTRNQCDIFDAHVRTHFARGLDPAHPPTLIAPSIGVLVSNKCTLTCVGCNHLRDYYEHEDNVDLPPAQILADLARLVSAVDMVNKLVVVGGESLLHPEIEALLEGILALPKVGIVQVITNGTVIPKSDRVFELLANERVMVEISGYGEHIPLKFERNVDRFIARLEAVGAHYRYVRTLQWFDFGGFEQRQYTDAQLRRVYNTCCFISNDIWNGQLHKCSRSAYGQHIGRIPAYAEDFVDLREGSIEALRARLAAFQQLPYPKACDHCNGASTATIPAGQQVRFVRKQDKAEAA
jgi:organic radical activating enzyme